MFIVIGGQNKKYKGSDFMKKTITFILVLILIFSFTIAASAVSVTEWTSGGLISKKITFTAYLTTSSPNYVPQYSGNMTSSNCASYSHYVTPQGAGLVTARRSTSRSFSFSLAKMSAASDAMKFSSIKYGTAKRTVGVAR